MEFGVEMPKAKPVVRSELFFEGQTNNCTGISRTVTTCWIRHTFPHTGIFPFHFMLSHVAYSGINSSLTVEVTDGENLWFPPTTVTESQLTSDSVSKEVSRITCTCLALGIVVAVSISLNAIMVLLCAWCSVHGSKLSPRIEMAFGKNTSIEEPQKEPTEGTSFFSDRIPVQAADAEGASAGKALDPEVDFSIPKDKDRTKGQLLPTTNPSDRFSSSVIDELTGDEHCVMSEPAGGGASNQGDRPSGSQLKARHKAKPVNESRAKQFNKNRPGLGENETVP